MTLLAFVDDETDESIRDQVAQYVDGLAARWTDWHVEPPSFVDDIDEEEEGRTVGLVMPVFAAFDEAGRRIPNDLYRPAFRDVSRVVDLLGTAGAALGVDFVVEIDQDHMGAVDQGEPDRVLREELLGPWRDALGGA